MIGVAGMRSRSYRFAAMALIAGGALLVVLSGGYYTYGRIAVGRLDSLISGATGNPVVQSAGQSTLDGLRDLESGPLPSQAAFPDPSRVSPYPGAALRFQDWAEPWNADPSSPRRTESFEGFLPLGEFQVRERGSLSGATRIAIPAIELDAEIQALAIQDLGDSRQYETPKHVVGHIPETGNPGEVGNGWLFGHLQSPFLNEGSVFRDLVLIPDLLETGEPVYVVLDGDGGSYLYLVHETAVVTKDDLRLYETETSGITLVTCVPHWTYSHRLLVNADLVGFKPAA